MKKRVADIIVECLIENGITDCFSVVGGALQAYIMHNELPIKIIIFSNNGYAAIRRTCKNFFNGTYTGCDNNSVISLHDFERVAYSFNIPYMKCEEADDIEKTVTWMNSQNGVCIVEVVQKEEDVMYPFISENEMNKYML